MESIIQKTGDYLETRIELLRLKTIDKSSEVLSHLMTQLALFLLLFFFLLILNIGVALLISDQLGKLYYGFFIVAGFYIIVGTIFYFCRKRLIHERINKVIVHKLLDK